MSPYDRAPEQGPPDEGAPSAQVPVCYRHPGRETYIRCQRCGRSICPDCMHDAAVGVQCPECVREGSRSVPQARGRFGGVLRSQDNLVTKVIIGINVAVFALVHVPGAIGLQLLAALELVGWGSRTGFGGAGGVAGGEVWRLLTAAFVHVEIWHIAINMFSLWILGPLLEAALGRTRFVTLYLVAALAGSAVAYAFTPPMTAVVGASGALFGVFGGIVVLARKLRADMTWILGTVAINIVLNVLFRGLLSWQAHLGGFAAGLALGVALAYAPRDRRTAVQVAGCAVVALAAVLLVGWRTLQLTA